MDQDDGPKTGPKNPTLGGPSHMRWDTSEQQSHACAIATASVTPEDIILNFGAKRGHDHQGGEVAVELLQRIALSPVTAKHLSATLEKVIADDDRMTARSKS